MEKGLVCNVTLDVEKILRLFFSGAAEVAGRERLCVLKRVL